MPNIEEDKTQPAKVINDKDLPELIPKYHSVLEEINLLMDRTKFLLDTKKEVAEAERDFTRILAIMGSHSKVGASAKSVESVQKFFLSQMKIKENMDALDDTLEKRLCNNLESMAIDLSMVKKDLRRLQHCKDKIAAFQDEQKARFMKYGPDDLKAQRLTYSLKLLFEDYEGFRDQLINTISTTVTKKNSLLAEDLSAFSAATLKCIRDCTDAILAEHKTAREVALGDIKSPHRVYKMYVTCSKPNLSRDTLSTSSLQPMSIPTCYEVHDEEILVD